MIHWLTCPDTTCELFSRGVKHSDPNLSAISHCMELFARNFTRIRSLNDSCAKARVSFWHLCHFMEIKLSTAYWEDKCNKYFIGDKVRRTLFLETKYTESLCPWKKESAVRSRHVFFISYSCVVFVFVSVIVVGVNLKSVLCWFFFCAIQPCDERRHCVLKSLTAHSTNKSTDDLSPPPPPPPPPNFILKLHLNFVPSSGSM